MAEQWNPFRASPGLMSYEDMRRWAPQARTPGVGGLLQNQLDPDIVKRGMMLPWGRTSKDELEFAVPEIGLSLARSAALPGHVARGGAWSPEDVTEMGANVAGTGYIGGGLFTGGKVAPNTLMMSGAAKPITGRLAATPSQIAMRANQAKWDETMRVGAEKYGIDQGLLGRISETALEGIPDIPLQGARQVVTPPPGVTLDAAVKRQMTLARQGEVGRYFYPRGAEAITRGTVDPAARDPFFAGLSTTSSDTGLPQNVRFTIKGHNQWMVGDPIKTGRYPNPMGARLEDVYAKGAPSKGPKHAAFRQTHGRYTGDVGWDEVIDVVNDQINMRGLGYGESFAGTPTIGQYNFARQVAPEVARRLNKNSELPWNAEQVQAAVWKAVRPDATGADVAELLNDSMAKSVWESMHGKTTGSRMASRPYEEQLAFHRDYSNVLYDAEGRDLIDAGFGLIVRPRSQVSGSFEGGVTPASVSGAAVGREQGTVGVMDKASRELWEASNLTHALLLRQDATAYVNPFHLENIPMKRQDFLALDTGRGPLTAQETVDFTAAMKREFGTDELAPIGDHNGVWFRNHLEGLSNQEFQDKILKIGDEILDGPYDLKHGTSEGFFLTNDWSKAGNGQRYFKALGEKRPGIQARSRELLARFGPELGQIEDIYIGKGWDINPNTRFWETPGFTRVTGQAPISGPLPLLPRALPRAGFFSAQPGAP